MQKVFSWSRTPKAFGLGFSFLLAASLNNL
jgi:hypothetical protein